MGIPRKSAFGSLSRFQLLSSITNGPGTLDILQLPLPDGLTTPSAPGRYYLKMYPRHRWKFRTALTQHFKGK